ncbi:hypothetical protein PNQ69_20685 [Xanthomonas sp. A2111]|uniref:Integrase zinc-binding domain-containing protein n=1 Tax=Xanthomonas hawaiiensis TaxID=3003247 RepID=A0ABU2ICN4_9XANT|nr:hypothetical protein [Xanthomonas sp. A2111]MDS9995182.1 hypothetical protein [Xanthomonas sp. A2111]
MAHSCAGDIGDREVPIDVILIDFQDEVWGQTGFYFLLVKYLLTLERPEDCEDDEWVAIKRKSSTFYLSGRRLMRRRNPNPQVVITQQKGQELVLKSLHEDLGHRGFGETFRRISDQILVARYEDGC